MASVNPFLSPIGQQETVRDYKHASRTFVENNYELQPRHSNLFHVLFNFTPEAINLFNTVEKLELPILVKSINLPSFAIDVQTLNQYNRQVQSHHKISYNPVTIRFHDDVKELVRNLWHKYYTFYSNDPRYDADGNSYNVYDRYANRAGEQWGLQQGNKRFFKNIKIYSMHQHKFAEYTLINPIITSFNHDNHDYANASLMEHTMSLQYETVKYATGYVTGDNPTGFGELHYDVEESDISAGNSNNQAFINGQLVSVVGQQPQDLYNTTIGTIGNQGTILDNLSNLTFGNVVSTAFGQVVNNILTGQKPTSNIQVPFIGKGSLSNLNANTVLSNIVNSQTNYGNNDIISSQGQSVGSTLFNNAITTAQSSIGYANTIPNQTGTTSNPNRISSVTTYRTESQSAGTFSQKTAGIEKRLNDPSIPQFERDYLEEQLRLMKL